MLFTLNEKYKLNYFIITKDKNGKTSSFSLKIPKTENTIRFVYNEIVFVALKQEVQILSESFAEWIKQ